MIPNIIHFIKTDSGQKEFSYLHYLAIYSAWKINRPENIFFHCAKEPNGEWWQKAKKYLELRNIEIPTEIFGNPITEFAHKADVIKLELLRRFGGIYLDLDVICINPFTPLLNNKLVMAKENNVGLCNAVILADKSSKFLDIWYNNYSTFNCNLWNEHSVKLPYRLSLEYPKEIFVLDEYSCFYPTNDDPLANYLLHGKDLNLGEKIISFLRIIKRQLFIKNYKVNYTSMIHIFFRKQWHIDKLQNSFCIHMWESIWINNLIKDFSPAWFNKKQSVFVKLINKKVIEEQV